MNALAPRLQAAFAAPRAKRAALIPYLTGGYPGLAASHRLIDTLVAAGADVVELGVPFSDPIADGPVVQCSTHEALAAGVTPDDVLDLAAAHADAVPFVLLVYVNTVLACGPDEFFARARRSGVEALVIPDLPVDEDGGLAARALSAGVALVPLAAPTTTDRRLDLVAAASTPFIYCVAVTGVTGARRQVSDDLPRLIARLRVRTKTALAVGFGVSTPEQAARVAGLADGVIMGSALIDLVARAGSSDAACAAVADLLGRAATAIAAG
jgi:tryptophan synthase alpha chain